MPEAGDEAGRQVGETEGAGIGRGFRISFLSWFYQIQSFYRLNDRKRAAVSLRQAVTGVFACALPDNQPLIDQHIQAGDGDIMEKLNVDGQVQDTYR